MKNGMLSPYDQEQGKDVHSHPSQFRTSGLSSAIRQEKEIKHMYQKGRSKIVPDCLHRKF